MNSETIEKMIEQYSKELLEMNKVYGGEVIKDTKNESPDNLPLVEEAPPADTVPDEKPTSKKETDESPVPTDIKEIISKETQKQEALLQEMEKEAEENDKAEEEVLGSSASFTARVFAGENIYPIMGAKVIVYKGDKIFAFVTTDENGTTKTVSLPAYPEENSLDSSNNEQSFSFLADVFASGFVTQKELPVSTVGGSDVTLDVYMTPESEGIN